MEIKGSFIGFTFGNRHSSRLGIFRTSQSNRYSTALKPYSKEVTVTLDNTHETLYFGQRNTKQDLSISFAFYGLTENQLSQLKRILSDKKVQPLIFDEEPYKVWFAKITSMAICKHICCEREGSRFYQGEGELTFTSYSPYASSRYEYLEDYTLENIREWIDESGWFAGEADDIIYPAILSHGYADSVDTGSIIGAEEDFWQWLDNTNLLRTTDKTVKNVFSYIDVFPEEGMYYNLDEWREASQIPHRPPYGIYDETTGIYKLYNAGDIPTHFRLYLSRESVSCEFVVAISDNKALHVAGISLQTGDTALLYDSRTKLLRGCDAEHKPTGTIYNQYIIAGDFFELPLGEVLLQAPQGELEFKYLYL